MCISGWSNFFLSSDQEQSSCWAQRAKVPLLVLFNSMYSKMKMMLYVLKYKFYWNMHKLL